MEANNQKTKEKLEQMKASDLISEIHKLLGKPQRAQLATKIGSNPLEVDELSKPNLIKLHQKLTGSLMVTENSAIPLLKKIKGSDLEQVQRAVLHYQLQF